MNWKLEYKNHTIMRQPISTFKRGYLYVIAGKYPANCTHKLRTIAQAKAYIDQHINPNT